MGCDIHLFVERKDSNSIWQQVEGNFYDDRNYDVFSILANVRNGYGFAGVDTGEGFIPICTPKGLPSNISPKILEESNNWGIDGYSHSWLTLQELLAYDWTQTTVKTGVVSAIEFHRWNGYWRDRRDGPFSYSIGVSGKNIKHINNSTMEALVKDTVEKCRGLYGKEFWDKFELLTKGCYAQVEWKAPYWKQAQSFFGQMIPQMLKLGSPEDSRIVFWFDN